MHWRAARVGTDFIGSQWGKRWHNGPAHVSIAVGLAADH
jgi:hypothetical protein